MNRMNFLDKLDYLMERDHLNKSTLSQKSGIPYTTIDAFYKKGYANVKLSTLEKLCACFSTSLDYLVNDKIVDPNYGMIENDETVSSKEEAELLSLFRFAKCRRTPFIHRYDSYLLRKSVHAQRSVRRKGNITYIDF